MVHIERTDEHQGDITHSGVPTEVKKMGFSDKTAQTGTFLFFIRITTKCLVKFRHKR